MSFKKAVIETNDMLAYIAFFAVAIFAMLFMVGGGFWMGAAVLGCGWLLCSLVFGAWFVLSDISESLRKISEKQ